MNNQSRSGPESIIVVSGLPRSGTSMMMQMLEEAGVSPLSDTRRTADEDNPKGYYEFEPVKELDEGNHNWLNMAVGKSVKVIASLLPYLPSGYEYKVIFMKRKMTEVLASQRKMLINRGEDPDKVSDEEMKVLFERHLEEVYHYMDNRKFIHYIEVDYNRLLTNPESQLEHIDNFIGKPLNIKKMSEVIDPSLYRQRS